MYFSRLRLHGFKSFVDPTDLYIGNGLTGIVGPNGCGKSNLVEALRWVMGETSPKRIRGNEMDDVIFAGTALRSSRNLAEVSLHLDNSDRSATAEFNDADELIVLRRIERGVGSEYRINGKPVRQRDVHLLFADQATGAHSTNIVGQGQIDTLIRARPQDRRQMLEEAAGTSGLQARRHEAELKLKAAEQNLTRLDDILNTLDAQLRNLKQQVRQASRYRNLAGHIRRTEAALMHLRWIEAEENAEKARETMALAEQLVADVTAIVARGNTKRAEIAAEIPALRKAEAAAAAIVQNLTLAREQIDDEARRVKASIQSEEQLLSQAQNDLEREIYNNRDCHGAVARLTSEQEQLTAKNAEIIEALPEIEKELETLTAEAEGLETKLSELMEALATTEAKQSSLEREKKALSLRLSELSEKRIALDAERSSLMAEISSRSDLSSIRATVESAENNFDIRRRQAQEAEEALRAAEKVLQTKRDNAREAQEKLTRLQAEVSAISALLEHHNEAEQVIDLITVEPGLENALAVALGEALSAAIDPKAAQYWRDLPPLENAPALPAAAIPLGNYIKAPSALARCLSQIGLVSGRNEGETAALELLPGQIIVSRDGWAWRWDGFTVTPDAKTSTVFRMQQRNRLFSLREEIEVAEREFLNAEARLKEAENLFGECYSSDQEMRALLQEAFSALDQARGKLAEEERKIMAMDANLAALESSLQQIEEESAKICTRMEIIEQELQELDSTEALRLDITVKRAGLAEIHELRAKKQSECNGLLREQNICLKRMESVAEELKAWKNRQKSAEEQAAALNERIRVIEEHLAQLRAKPAELATSRAQLLDELVSAETKRSKAAETLISAEQRLSVIEHQLKQDEAKLGEARENRVRAEAALQNAVALFDTLRERILEKLGCTPEELLTLAELDENKPLPEIAELEKTLERYVRERENMGPVNLRAETEAEAVEANISKLQTEKEDLSAAIAKLRQGIAQLNREARERLQKAFGTVNEHFQTLFKRMFGGGRAYLELIDNEDPMNAGLEIFASPPGKKMQALSLLSGGERSLTALALLFAVFQTNPSPICVLDEAEAALDESNIERFCSLIKDMARETSTRFLVVTHQRLTMAHMDRLYGVTMSEKGVSQLVSVDLESAIALRDGEATEDLKTVEEALVETQAA